MRGKWWDVSSAEAREPKLLRSYCSVARWHNDTRSGGAELHAPPRLRLQLKEDFPDCREDLDEMRIGLRGPAGRACLTLVSDHFMRDTSSTIFRSTLLSESYRIDGT